MATTVELPSISIRTETTKREARPFLGEVMIDNIQEGKYDGTPYQWVLSVKPLTFQIGGKTGAFHEYVSIKQAHLDALSEGKGLGEESKFGRHLKAFAEVFGTEDDISIGQGEYVGHVAWFLKDTILYGQDKEGKEIKGSILVPVRPATQEELAGAGLAEAPAPQITLTKEQAEALLAVLEGEYRTSLQKLAYMNRKELGNELVQAVGKGDGPAIKSLVEGGWASFDSDGKLNRS